MKRIFLTACLIMAGCAPNGTRTHTGQAPEVVNPSCSGVQQCAEMWSAAREWIRTNSVLKIVRDDDKVIQTSNPGLRSPDIAYRVTKKPVGDDQYVFVVSAWCGRLTGCWPDALYAKTEFNRHLASEQGR